MKSKKSAVPKEIMAASVEERIGYFEKYGVSHTNIASAFEKTMDAIHSARGPRVIIVAGPTGVGKSRLVSRIYRTILEENQQAMIDEPDLIPVLSGNAIAPHGLLFSFKEFYTRLLNRADEPLVDRKLLIPRQHHMFADLPAAAYSESATVDVLRRSVEVCMKRRRTKVLIIDEAHHMLMVNKRDRLEFQFEAIKSLSLETQATIVLVGTYKLLDIRDQSGQLVRRSEIVHFPRYDMRVKTDRTHFLSALAALASHLPIENGFDVTAHGDEIYQKCGGCIGVLKEWLTRALQQYFHKKEKSFSWEFVKQYAMSNRAMKTIIEEAMIGEEKQIDISGDELAKLLRTGISPQMEASGQAPAVSGSGTKKKPAHGVGTRAPRRDPTGGAYA